MNRITLTEPAFHHFSLGCEHHSLPSTQTSSFAVFRHYIRAFVEDLDDAVGVSPLEVIGGESSVMVLHLVLE